MTVQLLTTAVASLG